MGNRLSKIYTKTGDSGETGLGDGNRIAKDHPRVDAMGSMDELNSQLGLAIEDILLEDANNTLANVVDFLKRQQHRVFDLGGEVSIPGFEIINDRHVTAIEAALDEMNAELPPLENFILPGGSRAVASLHLARSICRRAERDLVRLSREETVNTAGIRYLNRLSDYLFVCARHTAKSLGVEEVLWERDR